MKIYPIIDTKKCTKCGLCIKDCVANAIDEENMTINNDSCMLCSHCSSICPVAAVSFDGDSGVILNKLPENIEVFMETLIKGRRSIRHYEEKQLPLDIINKILDVVNHAPTGTNSQKVSITIINNINKMKEFTDLAMIFFRSLTNTLINPLTYPVIAMISGIKGLKRLISYKKYIGKYFEGKNILTHNAPAMFIFHVSKKSSCPSEDGVIWATTASLYAESLGLGTCYNGFLVRGINSSKKLKKYLAIPKENRVYETFTIGYPKLKYQRVAIRNKPAINII